MRNEKHSRASYSQINRINSKTEIIQAKVSKLGSQSENRKIAEIIAETIDKNYATAMPRGEKSSGNDSNYKDGF